MKEYISKEELARCMKVKNIFAELSERNGNFCVVDAYPFGCEVLEWFNEDEGFDRSEHFTDSHELFDYLLSTWEKIYLYEVGSCYGNTELEEDEILEILPEEKKKEMEQIREGYIQQYRNLCAR